MKKCEIAVAAMLLITAISQSVSADPHRVGGGVHYWQSATSLTDGLDDDNLAIVLSYQYATPALFKFEGDVEIYTGGDETIISPFAHVLVGSGIYGGIGVGSAYFDGGFSDLIFNLRAGFDLELLPSIHLDLNANYPFTEFDQVTDFDADNLNLALIARVEL